MEFKSVTDQGNTRLSLEGDLDIYVVEASYHEITKVMAESESLTLDMGGVEQIDGAGLQLLIALKQEAMETGKSLSMIHHRPGLIEAIELCHLERFFGDPLILSSEME